MCAIIGATYGIGKKNKDIYVPDIPKALLVSPTVSNHGIQPLTIIQYFWLCEVIYILTCITGKISIAITILRVTVERSHRIILFLVIIFTLVVGFMTWFILLLQCYPVSYFWNPEQDGGCLNTAVIISISYIYSAFTAACDFTFGILPIAIVWNLRKSLLTKIGVAALLGLGCL